MFNRFKLLVLAIVLAILTILLLQNQEPLSLKFFCSDTSSDYCFYQTPTWSLAIWMTIFLLLGLISSLMWQLLNNIGNSVSRDRKYARTPNTRTSYREQKNLQAESNFATSNRLTSDNIQPNNPQLSDWEQTRSEDWDSTSTPNFTKRSQVSPKTATNRVGESKKAYDLNKDNQSAKRAPAQSKIRQDRFSKESANSDSENARNPISQNAEEVYDANYRTLNNVPPPSLTDEQTNEDEDPDWI